MTAASLVEKLNICFRVRTPLELLRHAVGFLVLIRWTASLLHVPDHTRMMWDMTEECVSKTRSWFGSTAVTTTTSRYAVLWWCLVWDVLGSVSRQNPSGILCHGALYLADRPFQRSFKKRADADLSSCLTQFPITLSNKISPRTNKLSETNHQLVASRCQFYMK